jgi:hypothetical protein
MPWRIAPAVALGQRPPSLRRSAVTWRIAPAVALGQRPPSLRRSAFGEAPRGVGRRRDRYRNPLAVDLIGGHGVAACRALLAGVGRRRDRYRNPLAVDVTGGRGVAACWALLARLDAAARSYHNPLAGLWRPAGKRPYGCGISAQ